MTERRGYTKETDVHLTPEEQENDPAAVREDDVTAEPSSQEDA